MPTTKDLTALVRGPVKPQTAPRHFVSNIMLAASPEGAHGRAYIASINFPSKTLNMGGLYDDVIVKTSEGWRFKDWRFIQDVPAEAPPAK